LKAKSHSLRQTARKVQKQVDTKPNLEKMRITGQTAAMTNKEIVQDLLRRIPDDASLQDIARELEFIAAVRKGLSELDNGDSVSIEEVEKELPSWIMK
jgi:hypothetical protein